MTFSGDVAEPAVSKSRKVSLADETGESINENNPLPIGSSFIGVNKRTYSYEESSFVTGDSPVVHDVETDLGRTGIDGYIVNDGDGDFKVEISNDGNLYGGVHTVKKREKLSLQGLSVSSIRITWVSDSSYRIMVI